MRLAALPLLLACALGTAEPVVQPTPETIHITTQPLPPLEQIVARPASDRPVYGLYVWEGEYRKLREQIRAVGWKQLRLGGPWDDDLMRMVIEDDIEVMRTVGGKKRNSFDSDEAFITAHLQGLEDFLTRYGPGGTFFTENPTVPVRPVTAVEIWNEPNFKYMILDREPRAEVEAEREALYAKLLPRSYATVKAKWPSVRVVAFSGGGASAGDLRWFQNLWKIDGERIAKSFDIASTHPYVHPAPPEGDEVRKWGSYSVAKSLAIIRKTIGATTPMWYTEVGWPISKADGGFFQMTNGKELVSPLLQAAYVCRMYAMALRLGVDRTHIMFATDTDHFNGGFFLRDNSWRPSAHAVQTMIRVMPFPKLSAAPHDGADGWYAWTFTDARPQEQTRPPVTMAFALAGPKEVTLAWTAPAAEVTDMLGSVRHISATNGTLSVGIGPCPIYLTPATK